MEAKLAQHLGKDFVVLTDGEKPMKLVSWLIFGMGCVLAIILVRERNKLASADTKPPPIPSTEPR